MNKEKILKPPMTKFTKTVLITVFLFILWHVFAHFAPAVARFTGYPWDQQGFWLNYKDYLRVQFHGLSLTESDYQWALGVWNSLDSQRFLGLPYTSKRDIAGHYFLILPVVAVGSAVKAILGAWKKDS